MRTLWPILTFFLSAAAPLSAQSLAVAPYRGDKAGALSLTFDDGRPDAWTVAVPELQARGLRATFFVITGTVDWSAARTAALAGHEIASHSTEDAKLVTAAGDLVAGAEAKLTASKAAIEMEIGAAVAGYRVHAFAYPYGITSVESDKSNLPDLVSRHYAAARTAGGNSDHNKLDPLDWSYRWLGAWRTARTGAERPDLAYYWTSRSLAVDGNTTPATLSAHLQTNALGQRAWAVYLYHSPGTRAQFGAQLDVVAALADNLWIAPFGEVARYVRSRAAAVVTPVGGGQNAYSFTLADGLPDDVYDVPLTLRFPLPEGWESVTAELNGTALAVTVANRVAVFETGPESGIITLRRGGAGTQPAAPVVALRRSAANSAEFEFAFPTTVGLRYTLERWDSAAGWIPDGRLAAVVGDGSEVTPRLPFAGGPELFRWAVTPIVAP